MPDGYKAPDDERASTENEPESTSRRNLLRATGATTLALGGLTTLSGTATAGDLKDEESCNNDDSPWWFGAFHADDYATNDHFPSDSNNITFFIPGFMNNGGWDKAYEIYQALRRAGYDGDVVTVPWYAGDDYLDFGWATDEQATTVAYNLAHFMYHNGFTEEQGCTANLLCHSLGSKVAMETLWHLRENFNYHEINTVAMYGGAVWDYRWNNGHWANRYYHSTRYQANRVYNYLSKEDGVLDDAYPAYWWNKYGYSREACGFNGVVDGPPNCHNVDVTSHISSHCKYVTEEAGIVDWIAPYLD